MELVNIGGGTLLEHWVAGLELPGRTKLCDEEATEEEIGEDEAVEEATGLEEFPGALLIGTASAVAMLPRPVPNIEPLPREVRLPLAPSVYSLLNGAFKLDSIELVVIVTVLGSGEIVLGGQRPAEHPEYMTDILKEGNPVPFKLPTIEMGLEAELLLPLVVEYEKRLPVKFPAGSAALPLADEPFWS